MTKIKDILKNSAHELATYGIESAALDARLLLQAATEKDNSFIFSSPETLITNAEYARFRRYIRRRKKGEPVAYILGHKEFFGLDFIVNKNVLIPRPETEWLVEIGICWLVFSIWRNIRDQLPIPIYHLPNTKYQILDMGSGSGCITISIIKNLENYFGKNIRSDIFPKVIKFSAADISKKALSCARRNAKRYKVQKFIKFYHSDLFSNQCLPKKFDLIIANLPYLPASSSFNDFEPKGALFAANNGTAIIKKFLLRAKNRINENGIILVELDPRQAKALLRFAQQNYSEAKVRLRRDIANRDRYLEIII